MATACYTPAYLPASFRGAQFWCVDASSQHGRRGAEGEFPFSERTGYQDLGRKIRHYSLKAVFRENSHIEDAGRLIAACETPGPAILVHPTRGPVRVACKSLRVSDNLENGQGETTADIEFVEAQDWLGAGGLTAGASLFGIDLGPLHSAVETMFRAEFDPRSLPFFTVGNVESATVGAMNAIAGGIESVGGIRSDRVFWRVISEVRDIGTDAGKRTDPDQVWRGISAGILAIDKYGASATAKISRFRDLANWAASQPAPPVLSARSVEAVLSSVRILAAGHMARAATESIAATLQEGLSQYDQVVTVLSDELRIARSVCDDARFLAIHEFMAGAQKALLLRAYELPPIVEYAFHGGVASLVAAHEIYGDAKRFSDLEKRNDRAQTPFNLGPLVTAVRA